MHRESKKPRKRRMLGKSTLFSQLTITNNEQRKCEYRYLCSGGSRGGDRGPESLLIPPIIRPNWGPKGQKNFFGDHPPPRHLSQGLDDRAPRYLKVWIRFYYVSFLLFTPRIKLPIKWRIMMSYGFK